LFEGGGGESQLLVQGCGPGKRKVTTIRFGYAENGQAVTFAHDEQWCINSSNAYVTGTYAVRLSRV
jgi:hypothetical protein